MKACFVLLCAMLAGFVAFASVVTYPAPAAEPLSPDYQVSADGQKVDVYTTRVLYSPFTNKQRDDYGGNYAFANFDLSGTATMHITSTRSLHNVVVRPTNANVKWRLENDHTLVVTLTGPAKLSIEPEGKKGPLLLFANPLEENPPLNSSPGVIYFGPGIHVADRIDLTNNQTLYLAGGAVVKGGVVAHGENIRILGRGILDGSDWPWLKGPTPDVIYIHGRNVEVNGITIRGAPHWTIVPDAGQHVIIRNVKVCGSRVQNDDGIDVCNSQYVLVSDCFIRSDDDCIALKGINLDVPKNNVERITIENSVLWCDRARIVLLGHESRAKFMCEITMRNLDIIHFAMVPFLLEPGEEMRLQEVDIEGVRVYGEGQVEFIRIKPTVNQYMHKKVPGHVLDVHFRDLALSGEPGAYQVQILGADAQHKVEGVTFENIVICGEKLTANSARVHIGGHVENITFDAPAFQKK